MIARNSIARGKAIFHSNAIGRQRRNDCSVEYLDRNFEVRGKERSNQLVKVC